MKITCEQCGAVYRIPEEKLTKDVSRATCKKCGAKLIIRRPAGGDDGYEDARLAGGHGGDDESVINHEERTVIAQVPELQKFDATPPLAAGTVSSPDELRAMMGNAPAGQPVINSRTTIETYDQTVAQPRRIGEPGPQQQPRAAATAPRSNPAPTPTVAPPITASTSPMPPSGREAAPVTPAAPAATVPTPSIQPSSGPQPKANVVDIFAQQNRPAGQGQDFQQPASKLSLVLLVVALVGILLFIPQGLWGLTRLTAVGFHVALYGILAAIMAQWDLTSTGRVNMVKVFLVPAVICLGLLAVLWKTQSDEIAFLHPELDLSLVKEYIASLPDAPTAERESRDALAERIKRMRSRPRASRTTPGNGLPGGDVPDLPADMTTGGAGVTAVASRTGEEVNTALEVPSASNPLLTSRQEKKLPVGPRQVAEANVQLDADGIERELSRVRIESCFTTSARGMDIPGRIELRISMQPDGSARSSRVAVPDTLQGTALEKCMQDKVSIAKFPTFDGKSQVYTKTFVR